MAVSPSTLPPIASFDDPKLEALIETMFLAAFADDEFSDEERAEFNRSVESLTDRRVTGATLEDLVARIHASVVTSGRDSRLKAVRARLEDARQRRVAFSLALQVITADGIIRTSEREMLLSLADALEIDREVAATMVNDAARAAGS